MKYWVPHNIAPGEHIEKHFSLDKSIIEYRNTITKKHTGDVIQLSLSTTTENLYEQASTARVYSTSVIFSPCKDLKYVILKTIST